MIDVGNGIVIRPGRVSDVGAVLALFDGAARWLVDRGRVGQWGTDLPSANPRRISMVTAWARDGDLYLACDGDDAVGVLAVGDAPAHVPAASEPELYVNLLLTDRSRTGSGIGGELLVHARRLARKQGVELLRVDCYGGDDRALVRYYEGQGFTATETFTVQLPDRLWPGQVLAQRLT